MRKFLQNNHNKYLRLSLCAIADTLSLDAAAVNLISYLKKGGWAA